MTARVARLPITILNGFLGSGKTTLLQNLLVQSRRKEDVRLGVIINEMSELDVDGRILDATEILSRQDALFASIPAGSISGADGLVKFNAAVTTLRQGGATHIIIETSGSTHPWPLLEAIRGHEAVQLQGFLSVVDTVTLLQDHDAGEAIIPAAQRYLAGDTRGIENLLAEQIMFAASF